MELAAGILVLLISILHIIYGERQPLRQLMGLTDDEVLIGSVRVMSLQGGVLLFAVGSIHFLHYFNLIALTGIAAYFPLGIICINLFTFLVVAIFKHQKLFSVIAFQLVVFTAIIVLQILSLS